MAIIDINLPQSILKTLRLQQNDPHRQQLRVLKKLLHKARFTEFGQQYRFDEILLQQDVVKKFQELVPLYNYSKIYKEWWHRSLEGKADVCWPGKIKYYALSSGTSEAASKYIPITTDLLKGNRVVMIKQILSLRNYSDLPMRSIGKGWLMLGGSTALQKGAGFYAGDLSGITAKKAPFWFQPFYKPGRKIARQRNWTRKLKEVVRKAPEWDIGFVVGVPAWIQMCMEMIIEEYKLNNIHDIWPNLAFFVHGGVSFQPYKKGFEKLLGKPLIYVETYLASEGFIAYQDRPNASGMRLVTNEHIFHEFIPFDQKNFDSNGDLVASPQVLTIADAEEGREYAILISTSAGAWRYLVGDTIRFTDKKRNEIVITGRTKHYLSLVGEHLSVENMNKAIELASSDMNISIPEFTVAGEPYGNFFAHHWYVACDDNVNTETLRHKIDDYLKQLNDDYATERRHALREVLLDVMPEKTFISFMRSLGKVGGQHKFPRVLKGKTLEDWNKFLKTEMQNNASL
jgi:hypothetical protein